MWEKYRKTVVSLLGSSLLFLFTGCPPFTKPDLVPKRMTINKNNFIRIIFANEGDDKVPENSASLDIFVDGRLMKSCSLSELEDQSFRSPGGTVDITTKIRIAGYHRRVALYIDPNDKIKESNEFQNTCSRYMTALPIKGADFTVSDLMIDREHKLLFKVKNIGSRHYYQNFKINVEIHINRKLAARFPITLPFLKAGDTAVITPPRSITIPQGSRVKVSLTTFSPFDELDNTNNSREEIFPEDYIFTPYISILSQSKIGNNIIWENQQGSKNYYSWSQQQKDQLKAAIVLLECGEFPGILQPPELEKKEGRNYFSAVDAWKIYIAHIAQSLWTEVHNIVPWSLTVFSNHQLALLLDSRKLLSYNSQYKKYRFNTDSIGFIYAWNPQISYQFLSNFKMIKLSQIETVYAFTDWMRGYLVHSDESIIYKKVYDYIGGPTPDRVLYVKENESHTAVGCIGVTGLYSSVLRSVNIPVESGKVAGNTLPIFPSIDRALSHGDDVYTAVFTPSGAIVPTEKIFFTLAELKKKFLNPQLDYVGSKHNSKEVQYYYNNQKFGWRLAHKYMTDYFLYCYIKHGADGLDKKLQGTPERNYIKPLFPDYRREQMIKEAIRRIRELGGGNFNAGKDLVLKRWQRFKDNK